MRDDRWRREKRGHKARSAHEGGIANFGRKNYARPDCFKRDTIATIFVPFDTATTCI